VGGDHVLNIDAINLWKACGHSFLEVEALSNRRLAFIKSPADAGTGGEARRSDILAGIIDNTSACSTNN